MHRFQLHWTALYILFLRYHGAESGNGYWMTNPSGQGSRIKGLLRLTGMDGYAGVQAFVKIFLVVSSSPDFRNENKHNW